MPVINGDSGSITSGTTGSTNSFTTTGTGATATTTGTTTTASTSDASVSSVAYYFSNQFQSLEVQSESLTLTGNRALANDVPLWNYVSDAVHSSLRTCASGPDGSFVAWYPDWFGKYDNTPVVEIEDVELMDFKITQSDSEFYSHVYSPGVTPSGTQVGYLLTQGVVSIESNTAAQVSSAAATTATTTGSASADYTVSDSVSEILSEMINIPSGDEWKYTPAELYRRYGARPKTDACKTLVESGSDGAASTTTTSSSTSSSTAATATSSSSSNVSSDTSSNPQYILPFLNALYSFMKHWANQWTCSLSITFMPNIFPGYRVKVKSLDISMYVQNVSHSMSYDGGFTTTISCSYPSGSLISGILKSGK